MHVFLYQDSTMGADLTSLASGISAQSASINCTVGKIPFSVPTSRVEYPETYNLLPQELRSESGKASLAICTTKIPYDNNFFYEFIGNLAIVSFYAWERLTTLPVNNGVVYFTAMILARHLHIGEPHPRTTGCISDFNADKTAIDIGMRSAFICPDCIRSFIGRHPSQKDFAVFDGVRTLLDELSAASRANMDIMEYWNSRATATEFDVFLCHNSQDKPEVRKVCNALRGTGVRPWIDEEQLRPGLLWQIALENEISRIGAAAVFVGPSNVGPWQNMELRAFLDEFVRRSCPVIPVLLPGIQSPPELPIFLRQMTWVDFRRDPQVALGLLIWGITGRRPTQFA